MNFTDNGLVSRLSKPNQAILMGGCRATELKARDVLSTPTSEHEAVYFLTGASVAQLVSSGAGDSAVGLVDLAGAVGLQFALDMGPSAFTMLVQGRGNAWMIGGDELRNMVGAHPGMLLAISRHMWADTQELARYAGNLQSQTIAQRLARWIVKSQGSRPDSVLELTQAHMARMLGVRRASVSAAALELRQQGLLDYTRGRIVVLDRAGLEAVARSHR